MKTRALFTVGMSALVLCGAVAGVAGGIAVASTREEAKAERNAAKQASKARKAFAKAHYTQAVAYAEAAVGFSPQTASYRMMLGQAYLKAGRMSSARQTFADTLALDPGNGKAALNLALAEIAEGNWDGARHTLDANASIIAASDRGLAVALAGDPAAAVEILTVAARTPDADAKTRQNLALSLALAGRWQEAKTLAAVDVAPGDLDQRIMEWASFARPKSASDQVASLLGVTPMMDSGQPVALALNMTPGIGLASVVAPVDTFMPGTPDDAVAVAADMGTPVPMVDAQMMPVAAPVSMVSFGRRQEVVQTIPARAVRIKPVSQVAPGAVAPKVARMVVPRAKPTPMAVGAVSPSTLSKGNFFVQLGAFENAAVAKDAWGRITKRDAMFVGHTPSGMPIKSGMGSFYRLSVGGFGRADADALCSGYKAKGGACFVRAGAGDAQASWTKVAKR